MIYLPRIIICHRHFPQPVELEWEAFITVDVIQVQKVKIFLTELEHSISFNCICA